MVDTVAGQSATSRQIPADSLDDADVNVVSLKDAARALGITESGVRKKLAKGQLDGVKDDKGRWLSVTLPAGVEMPPPQAVKARDDREVALLEQLLEEKERAIATKEDEIAFLRRQLDSRDMLYAESLRQMRALLPPESNRKPRRSWWPWGRAADDETVS
ncbi:MAG: hypothetical protein ACYDBB_16825 [Armatimonadota bacterium]